MHKCKKISILIISLFFSLIFIGCGQVKFNASTIMNINDDESGDVALYISYDDIVHSTLNRDIFDAGWAEDNELIFYKYNKDNMNVEELCYKFDDLKDLQEKINSTKVINMSYDTKLGFDKRTYFINLKFDKEAIDDLIKKNLVSESDKKNTGIYDYIEDVTLSNSITVPGDLIESNCSKSMDKNKGIWNYKLSEINENTEIKIVYSVKNYYMIIGLGVLFLVCFKIGLYYVKRIVRRWL